MLSGKVLVKLIKAVEIAPKIICDALVAIDFDENQLFSGIILGVPMSHHGRIR